MVRNYDQPKNFYSFLHYSFTLIYHLLVLEECRRERESLDNIALPPPWKEGVFGMAGGGDTKGDINAAIKQYCSDPALVKQALRNLQREVITVNRKILPPRPQPYGASRAPWTNPKFEEVDAFG